MPIDFAVTESNRCLYCYDAPCIQACPTHINIPRFIKQIASNDLLGASKTILSANPLGYSCSKVCPVEVLCAGSCVYHHTEDPPIQIGKLQEYATQHALKHSSASDLFQIQANQNPKTIAFIGGGPASITAVVLLTQSGHKTTIFEKNSYLGGLNSDGVAQYKLSFLEAQAEVNWLLELGITLKLSTLVSLESARSLLNDYDAVFVGIGAGKDRSYSQALGALELIAQTKTDASFKLPGVSCAYVIGGGNTAMDAARAVKNLGVKNVTVLYRRHLSEMSAYQHEIDKVRQDGIVIKEKSTLEQQSMPAELVVSAIGQEHQEDWKSFLQHPRVWSAGDFANGGAEVVNAVAEAKEVALRMLKTFEEV